MGLQVRALVKKSFKAALDENDILISPAAPSAAYKIGMTYCIMCVASFLGMYSSLYCEKTLLIAADFCR